MPEEMLKKEEVELFLDKLDITLTCLETKISDSKVFYYYVGIFERAINLIDLLED